MLVDWRKEWRSRNAVPSVSNQKMFSVLANTLLEPSYKVLIVGCGDGMLSCCLKGNRFRGIDLNPKLNRVKWLKVDAGDCVFLPYEDGSFDAVVVNSTLHYLRNAEEVNRAVREAERVASRLVILGDLVHPFEFSGAYCKLAPGYFLARGYRVLRQSWNNRWFAFKEVERF